MRLFAALRPPDVVLHHLAAALEAVRLGTDGADAAGPRSPVRWSPPENWHVTLAFYGDVPDGAAHELQEGLAVLSSGREPFDLSLRGAGVFAHRTLWVGVGGDAGAAAELCAGAREVGAVVLGHAETRERSRPHLTVGRVAQDVRAGRSRGRRGPGDGRPAPDELAGPVRALGVYEGPSWTVTDLRLVRSELGRGRGGSALHTDVARLALDARHGGEP
ncbi:RNA 2',3'-cyclic phosphodiesterase [Actinotalea sp. Marseille-Q4924]|uniref:RNA 2',3'-cyclic phosphodiesterase n=1 Tax=Actinotalea sp. Marseille-Q4924 TaxID=2866571 RepID=UPI001CE4471E|nr:RNA 2',3'-cyclic phosphodiesterase [Actinotalea sp. Marseille-Q4924]